MDQAGHTQLKQFIKKYVSFFLILSLGIVLMLFPESSKESNTSAKQSASTIQPDDESLQQQLSSLLSMVEGAGKVRVLLTISEGTQTIYQTDQNNSQINTIIINDNNRNQNGLISRIDPPKYLGAIVLCQGANSPSVKLAVTQAISNATGLGYDKISVLKMK